MKDHEKLLKEIKNLDDCLIDPKKFNNILEYFKSNFNELINDGIGIENAKKSVKKMVERIIDKKDQDIEIRIIGDYMNKIKN